MVRSNKGQAIGETGRSAGRVKELREFTDEAEAQSDLKTWRRGRAVHELGFSVQRRRKLLARAEKEAQQQWRDVGLPACQKKVAQCGEKLVVEDEASFSLDGTLHQTWSPVGVQPGVPTYGLRKIAHVFGAIAVEDGEFVMERDAALVLTFERFQREPELIVPQVARFQ